MVPHSKAQSIQRFFLGCAALIVLLLMHGCAYYSADFVPVIVKPGETLATLAEKYLDDPGKSWVIADFNDVTSITSGQEIIIPLKTIERGGLSPRGYQTVPILAYHNFSEVKENLMMVKKKNFEQQMRYLKENHYSVITLDELFDFLDFRRQLPRKSVVITFDDGWQGVYSIAYPILKKYGFHATLFVYTDLINGNRKTLNWTEVAELDKAGVDIQCHTKTHRNLIKIEEQESLEKYVSDVKNEIVQSSRIIKEKLNKDVKYFAYPYGDTNNLVIAFLQQAGFRGAFTVKREANPFFTDHYTLNRSMIYGDFSLDDFKRNLTLYSSKALK